MSNTPNLLMPEIAASQAQKHVTHNEALKVLDTLVQASVIDRDLTAPPASPTEGDRYIVASGAIAAWAGKDNTIAAWDGVVWDFYTPGEGWLVWALDEDALLVWNGTFWDLGASTDVLQNMSLLGVNTTADTTNKLAVKSNGVLFSSVNVADGGTGNVQVKLSKEATGDDSALLLQSNFSTRLLLGLLGNNDTTFKVSPDGSTFHNMIVLKSNGTSIDFLAEKLVAAQSPNNAQQQLHVLEQHLTGLSGATRDSTIEIPNGAIVFNVSMRVTTAITGATSFSVGVIGNTGQFGSGLGTAAGSTNVGVIGPTAFYSDTPIRLTSAGSNFTGGAVRIAIHFYMPQAPTS